MKRFRIQLVIALVVLICGVSLMGLIYILFNKPEVYVNPGVIVTQPSPVSSPAYCGTIRTPIRCRLCRTLRLRKRLCSLRADYTLRVVHKCMRPVVEPATV